VRLCASRSAWSINENCGCSRPAGHLPAEPRRTKASVSKTSSTAIGRMAHEIGGQGRATSRWAGSHDDDRFNPSRCGPFNSPLRSAMSVSKSITFALFGENVIRTHLLVQRLHPGQPSRPTASSGTTLEFFLQILIRDASTSPSWLCRESDSRCGGWLWCVEGETLSFRLGALTGGVCSRARRTPPGPSEQPKPDGNHARVPSGGRYTRRAARRPSSSRFFRPTGLAKHVPPYVGVKVTLHWGYRMQAHIALQVLHQGLWCFRPAMTDTSRRPETAFAAAGLVLTDSQRDVLFAVHS